MRILLEKQEKDVMAIMRQCKNYKCEYHNDSGSGCSCDRIEISSGGECLDCYVKEESQDMDIEQEMNFTKFMYYCKTHKIKCCEQTLGLLNVFGEEIYENYYDLIQCQVLEPTGYELIVRKKEDD